MWLLGAASHCPRPAVLSPHRRGGSTSPHPDAVLLRMRAQRCRSLIRGAMARPLRHPLRRRAAIACGVAALTLSGGAIAAAVPADAHPAPIAVVSGQVAMNEFWNPADKAYRLFTQGWGDIVKGVAADKSLCQEAQQAQQTANSAPDLQPIATEAWNTLAEGAKITEEQVDYGSKPPFNDFKHDINGLANYLFSRWPKGSVHSSERADAQRADTKAKAAINLWNQVFSQVHDAAASWKGKDCQGANQHIDNANEFIRTGHTKAAQALNEFKPLAEVVD